MTNEEAKNCLARVESVAIDPEFKEALGVAIRILNSLPADLDEACQKISEECYDGYFSGYQESHRIAARMGAEWMAGQGYTTEETVYFERLCDETRIMVDFGPCGERGGFKPGDRVIVQIRKK